MSHANTWYVTEVFSHIIYEIGLHDYYIIHLLQILVVFMYVITLTIYFFFET